MMLKKTIEKKIKKWYSKSHGEDMTSRQLMTEAARETGWAGGAYQSTERDGRGSGHGWEKRCPARTKPPVLRRARSESRRLVPADLKR